LEKLEATMQVVVDGKVYDSYETPIVVRFTDEDRKLLREYGKKGGPRTLGSAPNATPNKEWKRYFNRACRILTKARKMFLKEHEAAALTIMIVEAEAEIRKLKKEAR
jgi:hypothetical protein